MRSTSLRRLLIGVWVVLVLAGCGAPKTSQLRVDGSSALYPLVSQAAAAFQTSHPEITVDVMGTQSQAGRQGVCTGRVDIGTSDVPLSADEKTTWNCQDAVEVPVAIQAFAPVANPRGPGAVTQLSKDQLAAIFRGEVTNWRQVGGDDLPIVLVHRTQGSGTRDVVMQYILGGNEAGLAPGVLEGGNAEVARAVQEAPGAISYLGTAYLNEQTMRVLGVENVQLAPEAIQSGAWPIVSQGYLITKGQGSAAAQAFRELLTSASFQQSAAFTELGYTPVKP